MSEQFLSKPTMLKILSKSSHQRNQKYLCCKKLVWPTLDYMADLANVISNDLAFWVFSFWRSPSCRHMTPAEALINGTPPRKLSHSFCTWDHDQKFNSNMRTLAERTKYTYNIFFSNSFLPKKKNVSNCPPRQVLNNFERNKLASSKLR